MKLNNPFAALSSGTLAACGNQTFITGNIPQETGTGLVFIKVFRGGSFNWRFVYSGVIDSTFADGSVSRCNDLCDWEINSLSFAVSDNCGPEGLSFTKVLFGGEERVYVGSKKYVVSDSVRITAPKDSYICLKTEFSGKTIPCHKESMIAVYRLSGEKYELCPEVPVPVFSGIEYEPLKRVAFMGDSITQGIGATFNSYRHYAALVSEAIGEEYAFHNLGLGYGRTADAASCGIWLEKAKSNDIVSVCYGVNDIFHGSGDVQVLKNDLLRIVTGLKNAGARVLIQTVPPFDYDEAHAAVWNDVNDYIRNELAAICDGFFDNVPVLSMGGKDDPRAKYGGHPDDEGCKVWAEALLPEILKLL